MGPKFCGTSLPELASVRSFEMQRGAFVMLDALGFKAASLRDPEALMRKMRHLLQDAGWVGRLAKRLKRRALPHPRCVFLSDTIVLGFPFLGPRLGKSRTVEFAALTVGELIIQAGMEPLPVAYRGALSYGDFEMSGPFILGPAVNEAAEQHEIAQAAAVHLTSSARELAVLRDDSDWWGEELFVRWSLPLAKSKKNLDTIVINPFATQEFHRDERVEWAQRLLRTFTGTDKRVKLKRRNTAQLLTSFDRAITWNEGSFDRHRFFD
jgi:hypothetical protein